MKQCTRREFLTVIGSSMPVLAGTVAHTAEQADRLAFFLIGDTHYLARKERPEELDPVSRGVTTRLVDWLNRLPGTDIPEAAGGGQVAAPRGVLHAGDVIDSGDKSGAVFQAMQQTEWQAFEKDFGLTGKDGRLRFPVYEVHGNHDSPSGVGLAIEAIKRRNRQRPGLVNVSSNGLHYSWEWGPVHFVNLGIVVGSVPDVTRRRRYPPLDSLPFLVDDLAQHVRDRRRPVILTHHVDVARYSDLPDPRAEFRNQEWDPADVRGYYEAIKEHRVAAVCYGHTHVRNVFRWDGTKSQKAKAGLPVFNTDNVSHFNSQTQAFLYAEITEQELLMREFATTDAWQSGNWTPIVWRVPIPRT